MRTITLLALLLGCLPAIAQEPDWISKVTVDEPADDVPNPFVDNTAGDLQSLVAELGDVIDEARSAAAEAREAAAQAKALKSSEPVDLSGILADIRELKARPAFTESEIRAFAKEEAQKLVATVKAKDGTTREVTAQTQKVSVAGYAGTFDLAPGEVITHIDGQPVSRTTTVVQNGQTVYQGATASHTLRAVQPAPNRTTIWAMPRASSGQCRIVNGVRVCN